MVHNELDRELEEKHSEPMEPGEKEISDCLEKVEDNTKIVVSDFEEEFERNKSELH